MRNPIRTASKQVLLAITLLLSSLAEGQVTFHGKIVDQNNQPVANALINGSAPGMGPLLPTSAVGRLEAVSDERGQFSLTTAYPQLLFQITASKSGYGTDSPNAPTWIPDQPGELVIKLRRNQASGTAAVDARIRGRIIDGVPNLRVFLRDVRAQTSISTTTATDGSFVFDEVPAWIGRAILEAETGDKVLPLGNVSTSGTLTVLQMVRPGKMFGTVADETTGDPIIGAPVSIRARSGNRLIRTITTDENGTWSATQLPPGDYIVSVNTPTHVYSSRATRTVVRAGGLSSSGQAPTSEPGNVTVVPERVARTQITTKRKAIISGRVVDFLGNPVPDALVGAYDTWENDNLTDVRLVHTDAEGKFTMDTGRGGTSIQVVAFDHALGYGTAVADSIAFGERRAGLQIQLQGAARVSGTLLDPKGKGVEGITVTPAWSSYGGRSRTDARGRFDLGLVSIASTNGNNYELRLTSPKPRLGRTVDISSPALLQNIDELQVFYPDSVIALNAPPLPGNKIDFTGTITPTDLVIFRGRVLDAEGKPVSGASIQIFAGKVNPNTWELNAAVGGNQLLEIEGPQSLGTAQSAADGSYTAYVLRCDGVATEKGTQFSIGATATSKKLGGLSQDAIVPLDTTRISVDITVMPMTQPAGGGGAVRVR